MDPESTYGLTAESARRLLRYEADTGRFFKRMDIPWRMKPGQRADYMSTRGKSAGYYYLRVDGRRYAAHRVAWLYVHGQWPSHQIDHIDGDPSNNRIENLRDVPASVNQRCRRKPTCRNRAGFIGVSRKRGRWMAALTVNKRQIYLGYFDSPEAAHEAYLKGKAAFHGLDSIAA